jgi:hypothetical protein
MELLGKKSASLLYWRAQRTIRLNDNTEWVNLLCGCGQLVPPQYSPPCHHNNQGNYTFTLRNLGDSATKRQNLQHDLSQNRFSQKHYLPILYSKSFNFYAA